MEYPGGNEHRLPGSQVEQVEVERGDKRRILRVEPGKPGNGPPFPGVFGVVPFKLGYLRQGVYPQVMPGLLSHAEQRREKPRKAVLRLKRYTEPSQFLPQGGRGTHRRPVFRAVRPDKEFQKLYDFGYFPETA